MTTPDGDDGAAAAGRDRAALRDFLAAAASAVVFTGAGVSTESGIPDYRSAGGIWTRYDASRMTFDRYVADPAVRADSWAMRREVLAADPGPNAAHRAIAVLERAGRSPGVITQNIDGLHQLAGSRTVVELHGTMRDVTCIGTAPPPGRPAGCGFRAPTSWAFDRIDGDDPDPSCPRCGGLVKSATVSFGQAMDTDALDAAGDLVDRADAMLVIGSSLQVWPAAGLPQLARDRGCAIAILNDEPTSQDHLAQLLVRGRAAEVLPGAVDAALAGS